MSGHPLSDNGENSPIFTLPTCLCLRINQIFSLRLRILANAKPPNNSTVFNSSRRLLLPSHGRAQPPTPPRRRLAGRGG